VQVNVCFCLSNTTRLLQCCWVLQSSVNDCKFLDLLDISCMQANGTGYVFLLLLWRDVKKFWSPADVIPTPAPSVPTRIGSTGIHMHQTDVERGGGVGEFSSVSVVPTLHQAQIPYYLSSQKRKIIVRKHYNVHRQLQFFNISFLLRRSQTVQWLVSALLTHATVNRCHEATYSRRGSKLLGNEHTHRRKEETRVKTRLDL
jgi:hypothetical protein